MVITLIGAGLAYRSSVNATAKIDLALNTGRGRSSQDKGTRPGAAFTKFAALSETKKLLVALAVILPIVVIGALAIPSRSDTNTSTPPPIDKGRNVRVIDTPQSLIDDARVLAISPQSLIDDARQSGMSTHDYYLFSVVQAGGVTGETTVLTECLAKAVAKQPQGQLIDSLEDSLEDACMQDVLAVSKILQRGGKTAKESDEFVFLNYFLPAMEPALTRH